MRAIPVPFGTTVQEDKAMWGAGRWTTQGEIGFSLVELLVAIVVLGVVIAVAIVGIAGLTDKGEHAACSTSHDAANAATLAYFSKTDGTYPQSFSQLASPPSGEPFLDTAAVTITSPTTLMGKGGWTLTMHSGPTVSDRTWFDC
jgi:prepilin-type N-terminal cleavage/methylation domain-containing protein